MVSKLPKLSDTQLERFQSQLATRFSVSKSAVKHIQRGRSWRTFDLKKA
jgi:hypothetical protein